MRLAMPMAVVAPLATLVVLTTAWSAEATPSARLVYARSNDAASCPDEPSLHSAVGARFGYDPFFAWAKQTLVVQIWRDHERYAARVQLVDDQGVTHGQREITSDEKTCDDLFAAVALAISIALDASAKIEPSAPEGPEATPEKEPTEPVVAGPPPEEKRPPRAPAVPAAPTRDAAPRWLAGVDVLGAVNLSIDAAPGLAVFAARRAGALSLGAELQTVVSLPSDVQPTGRFESALLIATVAPCFHVGPAFACALGELGWQWAWSSEVETPSTRGTTFAAVGGRAGVDVPVSSSFFFRFHADGVVELNPATFELNGSPVWNAPGGALVLGAGAGALFL